MTELVNNHNALLINGTFVGFSIILVALFAGYIMNTPINKRLGMLEILSRNFRFADFKYFSDLFFSLIGCVMFIASGVVIIQYWNETTIGKIHSAFGTSDNKSMGITKGSLAIVNGIIFLVDVVFTFRD
jgi:hypothetical protein